jgi:hypothetical protein
MSAVTLTIIYILSRNRKHILSKRPKARRLGGVGKFKMPTVEQMRRKEERYSRMDSVKREVCEQNEAQKWRERLELQEAKRLERQEKERQRQFEAHQNKLERRTMHWILQALPQSAGKDTY